MQMDWDYPVGVGEVGNCFPFCFLWVTFQPKSYLGAVLASIILVFLMTEETGKFGYVSPHSAALHSC